jgi:hypothetical protein
MSLSSPNKNVLASEGFDIIGRHLYRTQWTGHELIARELLPQGERKKAETEAEPTAFERWREVSKKLMVVLQEGDVPFFITRRDGKMFNDVSHWFLPPRQITLGLFWAADLRSDLGLDADEVRFIGGKTDASVRDLLNVPPASENPAAKWRGSRLYMDRSALKGRFESSTTAHPSENDEKHSKRKHDAADEALLKNRIDKVLTLARKKWPNSNNRPGYKPMARELVREHGKSLGFKFETVRKILAGTYPASKRLGISGL